jgi:hypothetical protein
MKDLPSLLRAFHRQTWIRELLRRALVWFLAAVSLLALWTLVCIALSLPRADYLAAFMLALSLLPALLFWPLETSRFILPLRRADEESAIEAWMETEGGPALGLLEERARSRFSAIAMTPRGKRAIVKGLLPWLAAALASLAVLELASFLLLKTPTLVYPGPPRQGGSGIRIAEEGETGMETPPSAKTLSPDRYKDSLEAARRAGASEQAGATPNEVKAARKAGDNPARELPGFVSGEGPGEATSGDRAPPEASQTKPPGTPGQPAPGEKGSRSGDAEGVGQGVTGFEGSGKSGVASPLVDYRTRLFQMLGERTGKDLRASGELSAGELRDFVRRYFSSFALGTGLRPREDAYTALIKKRWAEASQKR